MKTWKSLQISWRFILALAIQQNVGSQQVNDLWQIYNTALRRAKYVDLTHTITPTIPVWKGFGVTFSESS